MRDIEKYTKNYEGRSFERYQIKYRRKMVLEQIHKYHPSHILELGCGMEPLFLYAEDIRFTIIEPSKRFFSNAKKLAGRNGKINLINDYFGGDNGIKLEKEYDMIICSALLHEVERPRDMVNSIYEICKEDTIVHINVPNADSVHRLLALESGMMTDVHKFSARNIIYQQHNVFDLDYLRSLLIEAHMRIIDEGSYFIKFFSHDQMLQMIDHKIISESVLDGLYNLEKYMPGLGSEIFVNCKMDNIP